MEMTKTMKRIFISLCTVLFCVALGLFFSVTSIFTAKAEVATTTDMYCDGASVRLVNEVDENNRNTSGIRFAVRIDTQTDANGNVTATLNGTEYSPDQIQQLNTGILLIPADKLSDTEELTLDGAKTGYKSRAKAANVSLVGEWTFKDGYCEAAAYIYNMPATSFEREFTYRGYYKVNDDEVYYTVENDKDTRSVSYVALQAKKDKENEFTTEQLKILNNFLPEKLVDVSKNFVNKGKYMYRLGNGDPVKFSSLFDFSSLSKYGVSIDNVNDLTITTVKGDVTSTITPKTKLEDSTVKFGGTGIVKLTFNNPADYVRTNETITMYFEIVNAMNATSAMKATENNVVLLNDVTFSTISVNNSHILYGNGFTMTAPNDVVASALGVGFVEMENGTLDNVQIICPNPSYSVLYHSNMKDSGNYHDPNDPNNTVHGNVRSAVLADANSSILNCYISGGRAGILARNPNVYVENTTIEGGAVANIYVGESATLTLKDITLIQEPKKATVYNVGKEVLGLSVLVESVSKVPKITLEGKFVQYAWVNKSYKDYVPDGAGTLVDTVWGKTNYKHTINDVEFVNLGIAYMNPNLTDDAVSPNGFIDDNRTNKSNVPYAIEEVTNLTKTSYVYTYKYTNDTGTDESFTTKPTYASNAQSPKAIAPTVELDPGEGTYNTVFDNTLGAWHTTLTYDLDTYPDANFVFADDLAFKKYGEGLNYKIQKENSDGDWPEYDGKTKITFDDSATYKFCLTIEDNQGYNAEGAQVYKTTHTYYFTIIATKTSIAAPEQVADVGGTPLLVVKSKNSDWTCAIPALEGTQIKYYNKTDKAYETLALSSLTPKSKGKQNGTNNYWEYSDPDGKFTLKVTCGYIHEGKQIYGMPVVVDNGGYKMYFTISSTNGYVSTSTSARAVTISYEFKDSNGSTLTFSKNWNFQYADYKGGTQYSYDNFVKGTLKEAGSGSSCIAEGTMITLADGTQKAVEDLQVGDMIMVFNHYTGKYDARPLVINVHADEEARWHRIVNIQFSNGALWRIAWTHGIYDCTLNEYVMISEENIDEFIGHEFYYTDGVNGQKVTMTGYYFTEEFIKVYSPAPAEFINYFANGLLNGAPLPDTDTAGQLNYFEFEENMMYDEAQMQADIEKYGLYTYEDFADYIPEELFYALPFQYVKISVAKGLMTWEEIIHLIEFVFKA